MSWSAERYVMFEDERTRPVRDLLRAVSASNPRSVVDLGCGPGNSTEVLAQFFPQAAVKGLDRSADMVAAARARLPQHRFAVGGIEGWDDPGPFGVILANAVLHWLPGHAVLLPRLASRLDAGGSLAVQLPDNLDEPAQLAMLEVAAEAPWAAALARAAEARTPIQSVEWYYRLMKAHCARVNVWRTTYYHPLAGGLNGVVDWFMGTGLLPFLEPLDADGRAAFVERYRQALEGRYTLMPDGTVLLPMPRLFIAAVR